MGTNNQKRAFAAYTNTKEAFPSISGISRKLVEELAIQAAAEELTPASLREKGLVISHDVAKVVIEVQKIPDIS